MVPIQRPGSMVVEVPVSCEQLLLRGLWKAAAAAVMQVYEVGVRKAAAGMQVWYPPTGSTDTP
jgi:hypothetical protein